MSIFKWLATIALAAAILPVLHAEPHCPGNVPSLRLRLVQRSQIIVPVTINHTGTYDFLVDTGAQVTTVDPTLAAELHFKVEGITGFVGVGFRTRPSFAHLDTLEAGSHPLANPLVVIQDMEHLGQPIRVFAEFSAVTFSSISTCSSIARTPFSASTTQRSCSHR
jgi:hypothetical protein